MRFMKYLLAILAVIISSNAYSFDSSTVKDMPFVNSEKYCAECHTQAETSSFKNRTTKSCSVYCSTCHEDLGAHHKVDLRLTKKIPKKLEFLNGKIACFTCHNLKSKRFDSVSWKSESLYESWFNSKKVHNTYFLTIRNNEGQLCKKCH